MPREPIINVIKKRREQAGMTKKEIANIAGMSEKTYQRIERGEADMRLSQYRTIIRAIQITDLDVSLDMLEIDRVTPWDVAAASRVLNQEARQLLVKIIMIVIRSQEKPPR